MSAALALPAALSRASEGASPSTIDVTSCEDTGPGTLRDALLQAGDGDTISIDALTCSVITLTSGELESLSFDVTLSGYGVLLSAAETSRVIDYSGHGTLTIAGLTIADGYVTAARYAQGGCVYSEGSVSLAAATVRDCRIGAVDDTSLAFARGGGVFAAFSVDLDARL